MTSQQKRNYQRKIETMDNDTLAKEIETVSFLAARCSTWSDYDEQCSILCKHNAPLYDAVRARLERSLRAR